MKNKKEINKTPAVSAIIDTPETAEELINKYGTYEIQPTCDRADYFPAIAQGLPTQPSGRNKKKEERNRRKG